MTLLVAWLLASTGICNSLLAILSYRQLQRTWLALPVAALSIWPLTRIPACELVWILLTQQFVVMKGLDWLEGKRVASIRNVSLATLIGWMVSVALVAALAAKTLPQGWYCWLNLWGLGVAGGLTTLLAVNCIRVVRDKRAWMIAGHVAAIMMLSCGVFRFDLLVCAVRYYATGVDWDNDILLTVDQFAGLLPYYPQVSASWLIAIPATFVILFLILSNALRSHKWPHSKRRSISPREDWRRYWSLGLVLLAVGAIPAYFGARLYQRCEPFCGFEKPNPGYQMLVATGRILDDYLGYGPVTDKEYKLEGFQNAFREIDRALLLPCHNAYGPDDYLGLYEQQLEPVVLALKQKIYFELSSGRLAEASYTALTLIRLMSEIDCNPHVHFLIGTGDRNFYRTVISALDRVSTRGYLELIPRLEQLNARIDILHSINEEYLKWQLSQGPWYMRLHAMMEDTIGIDDPENGGIRAFSRLTQYQFLCRTLTLELATRAYIAQHGSPPDTLNQLTPDYLRNIPGDPFAIRPEPFRYRHNGSTYLIYSVGRDRVDQQGKSPKQASIFPGVVGALPGDYSWDTLRSILDES